MARLAPAAHRGRAACGCADIVRIALARRLASMLTIEEGALWQRGVTSYALLACSSLPPGPRLCVSLWFLLADGTTEQVANLEA